MNFKAFFLTLLGIVCVCGSYARGFSNTHIGAHIGYGINGQLPLGISLQTNKLLYGFTTNLSVSKGVEGESYSGTINWDEFPEDHISEGSYKQSITLDLGYFITENLAIGGGVGYGWTTHYKNCYDEFHILGNNGTYYIESKGDGWLDAKAFLLYKFPISSFSNMYLKAGYGKTTSAFFCLGFQI